MFRRDAPGLGLALGGAAALLIALLFAFRVAPLDRADYAAVDYFARYRGSPTVSPDLLMVFFDDKTMRSESSASNRKYWALALRSLSRLGAKRVAFDVSFVEEPSIPHTALLIRVAEWSGRMDAVYAFEDTFTALALPNADRLIAALRDDLEADAPALALKTGLERASFESDLPDFRRYAAWNRVREVTGESPALTLDGVIAKLLREAARHPAVVSDVSQAYRSQKAMELVARRRIPITVERMPGDLPVVGAAKLVPLELVAHLQSVGHSNTPTRDNDGVLRRAPLLISTPQGPMVYMGLEVAAQALQDEKHRVEFRLDVRTLAVRQLDRSSGAETRRVDIPLDLNGSALVDWVRWPSSQALTMLKLIEYNSALMTTRVENLGVCIAAALKEAPDGLSEAYLGWGGFREAWDQGWTPALEGRLDAIEAEVVRDLGDAAAKLTIVAAEKRKQAEGAPASRKAAFLKEAERLDAVARQRRQNAEDIRLHERIAVELRPIVAGKICIVGDAVTSGSDIWSTPLGEVPGVNLQGIVANMLLTGRTLRYAPVAANILYIAFFGLATALGVTHLPVLRSVGLVFVLSIAACGIYMQVGMRASVLLSGAGPLGAIAAAFAVSLAWRELVTRRSQKQMRKELERRYSPELVEMIIKQPELLQQPRKLKASIFFSDIKGFTSISEGMKPEQLMGYMNRYHDRMTQILKQERAYVDKYIGDGIMALFGAPIEFPDHAVLACRAALRNVEATKKLSEEFVREGLPPISIRVGLNSGEIVAGYVGAADRADYTAIADAVNLAARLEAANKYYSTAIMAGEGTVALTKDRFWYRELDLLRVVGKKQGVHVYELIGERDGGASRFGREFQETYDAAMTAFRERNWPLSATLFGRCIELRPDDTPSNIHLGRAQGFAMNPPPPEWPGIFELTSK